MTDAHDGLLEGARHELERLRDETGYTASIATLDALEIVCLLCLPFSRNAPALASAGSCVGLPAYCTALGKVLVAYQPARERDELVGAMTLERRTATTITDDEAFRTELEGIREARFAISDEEYMPGLQAIAVAVYDPSGNVAAAVGLSAQSFEPSIDRAIPRHLGALARTSQAISARLGFRGREHGSETTGS